MDFSVIVPFSDARPYVEECADSLRLQSERHGATEVIFADAGSADGSLELLRSKFPAFRIVRSRCKNPYRARNLAARSASGTTLVFTDADCVVGHQWLAGVRDAIANGADMVTGPVVPAPSACATLQLLHEYENTRMEQACHLGAQSIAYAYTNNLGLNTDLFHSLGGFQDNGERGGDSEFVLRALNLERPKSMAYSRDMGVVHLEVTTLSHWWRKKFLYGQSATAGRSRASYAAAQASSSGLHARLVFALLIGRICYGTGRLLSRRRVI